MSGSWPAFILSACLCSAACAAGIVDESADYAVETVFEGLDRPTALAVRRWNSDEAPHEFFIAESGAGQVRQVLSGEPPSASVAVAGLPDDDPLALVLTTRTRLLVGSRTGAVNFVLPREATTLQAGESGQPASIALTAEGPADFYGFALGEGPASVFAAAEVEGAGLALMGGVSGNRVSQLGVLTDKGMKRPRGVALTPSGRPRFVVVADSGGDEPGDSSLCFFKAHNGEPALTLPAPLDELRALAYSPEGELYGVNGAGRDEGGGLYRLDEVLVEGRQECRPALIALLDWPTAVVFAPDGIPYVVTIGESVEEEPSPSGALHRVSGNFE